MLDPKMDTKRKSKYLKLLFLILVLIELFHIKVIFGNAELLAGGDNYTFLQVFKGEVKPFIWDSSYIPLGGVAFYLPYTFSIPLYSQLLSFLPYPTIQRIILFVLFMLRYIALIKLLTFIAKKLSLTALLPVALFYGFNVFESLNPFSLFPLMFSVYLPFSLYYFLQLTESPRVSPVILAKLLVLALVFSPLNANTALSITVFVPQGLYLLLNVRRLTKTKIINLTLYYLLLLASNFWWIYVLAIYFIQSAESVISGGWFSATGAGSISENFRFIGQWGWYGSHYLKQYYPFNKYYDNPVILLATFVPIIVAFFKGFKHTEDVRTNNFKKFFVLLALLTLFFVSGVRPPFGFIYQFLYDHVFLIKIFREPFTKFIEIYILAICVLCYLFLIKLEEGLTQKKHITLVVTALAIVIMNIKPVLLGEHVWSSWNGSMRTMQVNIPQYWKDFEAYTTKTLANARILATPKVYYGAAWNWPNGFTSADDVAVNFVHNGNSILRGVLNTGTITTPLLSNIFNKEYISKEYLALLGINYVLQENDLDWRYSGDTIMAPTQNDQFLSTLNKNIDKTFGIFDKETLSRIANPEPILNIKNQLYYELLNKPILSLYSIPSTETLPLFYIPAQTVYSVNTPENLEETINATGYNKKTQYILRKGKKPLPAVLSISDEITSIGELTEPKINFDTLVWNASWSWPTPSVSPYSKKYLLAGIKEKLLLLTRFSFEDRVDTLLWVATKKIAEIDKFNLKDDARLQNIKQATELYTQAVQILDSNFSITKEKEYWAMHEKLYSYIQRSLSILQSRDTSFEDMKDLYDFYSAYATDLKSRTSTGCTNTCYFFEIPKNDSYALVKVLGNTFETISTGVRLTTNDIFRYDYKNAKPRYIFELNKISKDNVAQFIKLPEWNARKTYKLSFDYKIKNSDFDVIILEDKTDYSAQGNPLKFDYVFENKLPTQRKKLFNQTFTDSRICLDANDACFSHFERQIKASSDTRGGYLYITLPAEDASKSAAEITNIKIEEYNAPLFVLKDENVVKKEAVSDANLPAISFTKINPTKYEVTVQNATLPYSLVFNESFSKFWRVYTQDYIEVAKNTHYLVNAYANSWYIYPKEVGNKQNYKLIVEFSLQKYLDVAFYISKVIIFLCLTVLLVDLILYMLRLLKKWRWQ